MKYLNFLLFFSFLQQKFRQNSIQDKIRQEWVEFNLVFGTYLTNMCTATELKCYTQKTKTQTRFHQVSESLKCYMAVNFFIQ